MKNISAKIDPEMLSQVAALLKVIAHPVRLEIIDILSDQQAYTVKELQAETSIEQSLLSHHLIKMKDCRILESYREGKCSFYRLAEPNLTSIFGCMEQCSILKKP